MCYFKGKFFDGIQCIYSVCKRTMLRCFCPYSDGFIFQEICLLSLFLLCLKGTFVGSNLGLLRDHH